MKHILLVIIILWMCAPAKAQLTGFTENRGQVKDTEGNIRSEVLYVAHSGNASLFFMRDRIACVVKQEKEAPEAFHKSAEVKKLITSRFDIILDDGASVAAAGQLPGYSNFYLAHCPQGITHVASYSSIIYENIYDQVDLHVVHDEAGLKLDFVVNKKGDASLVKILFEGEDAYQLDPADNIVDVSTKLGVYRFAINVSSSEGKKVMLSNANVEGSNEKSSTSVQPLTTTTWATYIGGADYDDATGIALDAAGDVYTVGTTQSTDLPVGTGTVQDTLAAGYDAHIFKLDNVTGNRVWATYYGGSGTDFGYKVKVKNGMAVMCGYGSSTNLPMLPGSWQSSAAGSYDGFIVKLDAAGALNATTYYGGPGGELLLALDMDKAGNIFTGGSTSSVTGLPISAGAFQTAHGGAMDAFCAKLDPSLQLVWATYYGGTGSEDMHAMTLDTSANVIFSGGTYSSNFPVTPNAFQSMPMGGGEPYIVKMDSSGARLWATYIGGYSNDDINGLAADRWNNIYVAGYSESLDFPVTSNAYQSNLAGASDAIIAKFDPSGAPSWITFYGGSLSDYATSIDTDTSNNIFIGGHTNSSDFAVSSAAFQPGNAGGFDAYFLRFDSAQAFGWGTFFGGSFDENVYGLAVNDLWDVFIAGNTSSLNLPDTGGVMQPAAGGNTDGFAAKLDGSYGLTIGMEEAIINELNIYPNPANDIIYIDMPAESEGRITITDVTGRIIRTIDYSAASKVSADISALPPGLYLIKLDNGEAVTRIIKM